MRKQGNMETAAKLSKKIHRFTDEFKAWVNGDFRQLLTKTDDLVVDVETLLASVETCVKLTDALVERVEKETVKQALDTVIERQRDVFKQLERS